jgi:hypothetical protein
MESLGLLRSETPESGDKFRRLYIKLQHHLLRRIIDNLRGSGAIWCCSGEFTSPNGGVKPPLHQTALPPAEKNN